MLTATEFVKKYSLKLETFKTHHNPHTDPSWQADHWQADHWHCVLTSGDKVFSTYYSKGVGCRHAGRPVAPKMVELLECLQLDFANTYDDFEDWAVEMGYDVDSRKAEAVYNAVRRQRREFGVLGVGIVRDLQSVCF